MERQGRPRALLAPAPGETHVLGLAIVRTYFEKCGWSAELAVSSDLEAAVMRHWYELVAFSISCDRFVDALTEAATRIRNASQNPNVFLLIGGPIVASDTRLAARIGADAGAATAQEAIVVTRSLLRRGARL
jgi:methanogenic corrinoid protein MtbC1